MVRTGVAFEAERSTSPTLELGAGKGLEAKTSVCLLRKCQEWNMYLGEMKGKLEAG